jgi:hypothetical protein
MGPPRRLGHESRPLSFMGSLQPPLAYLPQLSITLPLLLPLALMVSASWTSSRRQPQGDKLVSKIQKMSAPEQDQPRSCRPYQHRSNK